MVCSHERSGTHFLMNSLSSSTFYTVEPFLNYDYFPLGSSLNFYSKKDIFSFIQKCSNISTNTGSFCINSIIKSHFPLSLIGDDSTKILKIGVAFEEQKIASIPTMNYDKKLDMVITQNGIIK